MNKEIPEMQGNNREIGYKKPPAETQFKKGESGNPAGRPKSAILSTAYRNKLSEVDETDTHDPKRTYAEIIAEKMILKAKGGDVQAMKEIADRVEGKAKQTVQLSFTEREQLESAITGIIRDAQCGREEAIKTIAQFKPEALALLNLNRTIYSK